MQKCERETECRGEGRLGQQLRTAAAIQSDGGIYRGGLTGMYLDVVRDPPDGAEDPTSSSGRQRRHRQRQQRRYSAQQHDPVGGTFVGAQWTITASARGRGPSDGQAHQRQLQPGRGAFDVDGSLDTASQRRQLQQ